MYIYTTAKLSCQNNTHTQNTVNRKRRRMTALGSGWAWTWLKALISPREKTNRKQFFEEFKTSGAPWDSAVGNGRGGREGESRSLSACQGGGALPPCTRLPETEPQAPTGGLLTGKVCVWLKSGSLGYQALPTSTTMAELIYRFPE